MPDWINTFDSKFEPIMTTLLLWSIGPLTHRPVIGPRYRTMFFGSVKNILLSKMNSYYNWIIENTFQMIIFFFQTFSKIHFDNDFFKIFQNCLIDSYPMIVGSTILTAGYQEDLAIVCYHSSYIPSSLMSFDEFDD